MRVSGIENIIMVDASGYGQETGPIIKDAQNVLDVDRNKNIFFHIMSIQYKVKMMILYLLD